MPTLHLPKEAAKPCAPDMQVKEILAYAAQRFIDVVPEIELPGHCGAALASYPYLGCRGRPAASSAPYLAAVIGMHCAWLACHPQTATPVPGRASSIDSIAAWAFVNYASGCCDVALEQTASKPVHIRPD